jgi:hypothetical protein
MIRGDLSGNVKSLNFLRKIIFPIFVIYLIVIIYSYFNGASLVRTITYGVASLVFSILLYSILGRLITRIESSDVKSRQSGASKTKSIVLVWVLAILFFVIGLLLFWLTIKTYLNEGLSISLIFGGVLGAFLTYLGIYAIYLYVKNRHLFRNN